MQFEQSHSRKLDALDLFSLPPTQNAVKQVQWVEIRPLGQILENAALDFIIPGNSDYLDLKRSYLHVTFKVVKSDGKDAVVTEKVSVVNNVLHSLWSQVDTFLNQQLVSSSTNNYPYKAYLDNLLMHDTNVKGSRLQNQGFYKDIGGAMDATNIAGGGNTGLLERYGLVGASKDAFFYGPLKTDVCMMDRWIVNGVDVHLRLWPSKNEFVLIRDATTTGDFKVKITNLSYHVCKVTLNEDMLLAQNSAIVKQPAMYPYIRSRVQTYACPTGSYIFREDNLFQFEKPQRVIVGFVDSNAYQGSVAKNPFNFQHKKMTQIALYLNDVSVPWQPVQVDLTNGNYLELYQTLFTCFGIDGKDKGNDITLEDYKEGYTLIAYDLSGAINNSSLPIVERSSLRIEAHFKDALTTDITAIIYGQFPDVFQIDQVRNVIPRKI